MHRLRFAVGGNGEAEFTREFLVDPGSVVVAGSQGCLTLTRDDGTAVDLWIRHPADLRRVLGIGE